MPKTYKTWEIWQHAEQLEGKRFKLLSYYDEEFGKGDIAVVVKYCKFYGLGAEKFDRIRLIDLTGFEEWELVQEPISFIEAIKAYSKGKTIKCKLPWMITIYKNQGLHNSPLYDNNGRALSFIEILEGKWHIE